MHQYQYVYDHEYSRDLLLVRTSSTIHGTIILLLHQTELRCTSYYIVVQMLYRTVLVGLYSTI